MSRLVTVDSDPGFYSDPRIVALLRSVRDPVRAAAYAAMLDALWRASWKAGARLTLDEGLPAWWPDVETVREALEAVGLVDVEGRVPAELWADWYEPALERVRQANFRNTVGGLMRSMGMTRDEARDEARRRLEARGQKIPGDDPDLATAAAQVAKAAEGVPIQATAAARATAKAAAQAMAVQASPTDRPTDRPSGQREEGRSAWSTNGDFRQRVQPPPGYGPRLSGAKVRDL